MIVDKADSRERPFGACIHMDHVVMRGGSAAAKTARFAFVITDEKTNFKSTVPARDRCADTVADSVNRWRPRIRCGCRQNQGPASFGTRPFGAAPAAVQWGCREVEIVVIEGGRRMLLQSGVNEDWRPFVVQHWCANYNASHRDRNACTPWSLRFGQHAEFVIYPFGALVFFKGVKGCEKCEKWADRLIPAMLMGVSLGPGMQKDKSYYMVPLGAMLGGSGPQRPR